jgi:hypothetical protein
MAYLKEQNVTIKSCFKLGKNSTEIFKMSEVPLAEQRMWKGTSFGIGFLV